MDKVRCCYAKTEDECFTQGRSYVLQQDNGHGPFSPVEYYVLDDEGDEHELVASPVSYTEWEAVLSPARFIDEAGNTQSGSEDTQTEYVCTEGEEEIFKGIEKKQQPGVLARDHVHIGWTQEETMGPQESVDCSVAVAHHIREIQKWLQHIGCSSEAELRITSDHVWVSPQDFVSYEAKEGGVGTLIEYLRIVGAEQKCLEKMEEI